MTQLKLSKNGKYLFLKESSGKKITAGKLEVGKTYINHNQAWTRKIIAFNDNEVGYSTFSGYSYCSKQHFARKCQHEATELEIEFLNDKDLCWNREKSEEELFEKWKEFII